MLTEAELQEYQDEIREKVCSCCVERPAGGPPCGPLGKVCGVELHLERLVEAVREVHSPLIEPYRSHNRQALCTTCPYLHHDCCPCPMDTLTLLVTEAIEAVDERHARREHSRAFLAGLPNPGAPGLADIDRAYRDAAGTWAGCDWPTTFGRERLNLQGWTAAEAESRAVESIWDKDSQVWVEAAGWLRRVEAQAAVAEAQAGLAVAAAHRGEWAEALACAHRAWSLELNSGRPLRHEPPVWKWLFRAVAAACPPEAAPLERGAWR